MCFYPIQIIPTDAQHAIYINFPRDTGSAQRVSDAALLDDQVDLSLIKDNIAVVGLTSKAYTRAYAIPRNRTATTPGITAAALNTLLSGHHLQRTSWALLLEAGALFYFLFSLLIVIPRVRLRIGGFILLVFLTTWWGVAAAFFLKPGYMMTGGFDGSNGTIVNGRKIKEITLRGGLQVEIGKHILLIEMPPAKDPRSDFNRTMKI
jgi:CHASE2 domain-containing sensor protein